MNKCIIYTRPDGGLSVVLPAPQAQLENESETDFIQRILNKDVPPNGINPQIVDTSILPSREFRDAWKQDGSKVDHDMPKCRDIWKEKLRSARAPKLSALDIEYQRADESSDSQKKSEVAAKKQALRDVTADPRIESAVSPEELKQVWPDILKGIG